MSDSDVEHEPVESEVHKKRKHIPWLPIGVVLAVLLSGASLALTLTSQYDPEGEISQLRANIVALKAEQSKIHKEIKSLNEWTDLIVSSRYKKASLSTSEFDLYDTMDSSAGTFVVLIRDIQPYMDGYKVKLGIGNLSSATYSGFKLTASYQKGLFLFLDSAEPSGEKNYSFTNELKPGHWTNVDIIVAPASADEFKYLNLSIETDNIRLD